MPMKIKKVYSIILCIFLVLGLMTLSFADGLNTNEKADSQNSKDKLKISEDEAKSILEKTLKEIFEIDIEQLDVTAYLDDNYKDWKVDFEMRDTQKRLKVHGTVDTNTGEIKDLNIHGNIYDNEKTTASPIDEKAAVKIAEDLVRKMKPVKSEEVDFTCNNVKRYDNDSYDITFYRKINKIKFNDNYMSVTVNATNSNVESYHCRWDNNIEIPSVEDIIDLKRAEETIKGNVDMDLKYISNLKPYYTYGYNEEFEGVKLVYEPEHSLGYIINAKTGKKIDRDGILLEQGMIKDISEERKSDIYNNAKNFSIAKVEIDETKGKEIIKSYIKEFYGEGFKIDNLRNSSMNDIEDWQMSSEKTMSTLFRKQDYTIKKEANIGSITIDAVTGEILSLYGNDFGAEELESRLTWEEAYDKAINVIANYFPSKIKDIETKQVRIKRISAVDGKVIDDIYYNFNFHRKVNDVIYNDNLISIAIEPNTGNIIKLKYEWNDNIEFPKIQTEISVDEAREIYTTAMKVEPIYILVNNGENKKKEYEMKLVYTLVSPYINMKIDACTGKILDNLGNESN